MVMGILCLPVSSDAQQTSLSTSRFYGEVHTGIALFWGDLYSIGTTTYPGVAGGPAAGYRLTNWLATEISAERGVAVLGASGWQTEDYINSTGTITYTQGNWKLGDIYSRTTYLRTGVRFPVQVLTLLSPSKYRRADLELAPHYYLNRFWPGIYDKLTNGKLTAGARPANWFYSVGGDAGIQLKLDGRSRIYLRTSVSWLSDDRFEGIRTDPSWRVNIQSYTSAGFQFDIGGGSTHQKK